MIGDAVLNIPAAFLGDYPGGVFAVVLGLLLTPKVGLSLELCE